MIVESHSGTGILPVTGSDPCIYISFKNAIVLVRVVKLNWVKEPNIGWVWGAPNLSILPTGEINPPPLPSIGITIPPEKSMHPKNKDVITIYHRGWYQ
jgi:hypothetical protein